MELTLKLLSGKSAGKDIKITTSKFLIGRADDCHLRPHSDLVSRHHCVVMMEDGFCAVRDFGSRNGTYVNDERIVGQKEIHNGDKLKVGVLEFEVELTSHVGGKKRPKVKDIKDAAQRTAATPARGGDEDDISDWLAAEEEDVSETRRIDVGNLAQPPHETPAAALPSRETVFIKKSPTEETTAHPIKPAEAAKPAAENATKETASKETAQRLFGKTGGPHKNAAANSRDAAADALKKFFGARKP